MQSPATYMIRAASAWRTFSSRFSTFRMIWRSWSVRFSSICMSWTEPVVAADISRPATWLPYVVLLLLVCISASGLELLPLLPTPLPPTPPAPFACGVGGNRARPLAILWPFRAARAGKTHTNSRQLWLSSDKFPQSWQMLRPSKFFPLLYHGLGSCAWATASYDSPRVRVHLNARTHTHTCFSKRKPSISAAVSLRCTLAPANQLEDRRQVWRLIVLQSDGVLYGCWWWWWASSATTSWGRKFDPTISQKGHQDDTKLAILRQKMSLLINRLFFPSHILI